MSNTNPSSPPQFTALVLFGTFALTGCRIGTLPGEGAKEADANCYWMAKDYAREADVRAALTDGRLTVEECSTVIMPRVKVDNDEWFVRVRKEAVDAARKDQS